MQGVEGPAGGEGDAGGVAGKGEAGGFGVDDACLGDPEGQALALGGGQDERVADPDMFEKTKMGVAVGGDDGKAGLAGIGAGGHQAGAERHGLAADAVKDNG